MKLVFTFILLAAAFLGGVASWIIKPPEIEYVEVPVEVIKEVKTTVYQRAEVVKELLIYEELIYPDLAYRPFPNQKTLGAWLLNCETIRKEYNHSVQDCDDFAIQLCLEAATDGYFIGLLRDGKEKHWKCFTYIGNRIYEIEATNGGMKPLEDIRKD